MTITVRRLDDIDSARVLHDLAFEADKWVGDDHTFWVARDPDAGNRTVGFASAIFRAPEGDKPYVFLSRAAVVAKYQGQHLQRRLIAHRVFWGWWQGAEEIRTYTTLQNYPSMVNLLREGFSFYRPETPYAGKRYHYFRLSL
jgi:GNAT superfamily N-acetyltransferase